MTNLTFQEKQALEEVFLCFHENRKWYKIKIDTKKIFTYKILKIYVKNKNTICKFFVKKITWF